MALVQRPGVFSSTQQQYLTKMLTERVTAWANDWLPSDPTVQMLFNEQLFGALPTVNENADSKLSWLKPDAAVQLEALRLCLFEIAGIEATRYCQDDVRRLAEAMILDWSRRLPYVADYAQQIIAQLNIELRGIHFVFRLNVLQLASLLTTDTTPRSEFSLADALAQEPVSVPLQVNTISLPVSQVQKLRPGMVIPLQHRLDQTWILPLSGMQLEGYLVASGKQKALYIERTEKVGK